MSTGLPSLQEFLRKLELQFEGMQPGSLNENTEFRALPEWTSMQALIVLASFDWEYGILVPPEVLKSVRTLGELYQAIQSLPS